MIREKIKILLVEDNLTDAKLIKRQIHKIAEQPEIKHITHYSDLASTLEESKPDLVLSDYNLQGYTGMDVLIYVNKIYPSLPLIFVTGTVNDEELAANTILSGASGFILKNKINLIHEKLLPHFEKILRKKGEIKTTGKYTRFLNEVEAFIQKIKIENEIHRVSYTQIKKSLQQFRDAEKEGEEEKK